ncbi:hypothetical protein OROMI_005605 [Orobanche minor]
MVMEEGESEKMGEGNRESCWVGKDKILVQTSGEGNISDFYIMDLRGNKITKLEGCVLQNHNIPGGLIVVDSVIYAVGRPEDEDDENENSESGDEDYHVHSGASFLDLTDLSGGWKDIGRGMLNSDRKWPSCTSLHNKIFVFSASSYPSATWAFGEFYDNTKNKTTKNKKKKNVWTGIPLPPLSGDRNMSFMDPLISDPKNDRIIVYYDSINSLYAFYPKNNHMWVCLDNNLLSWGAVPSPSPIDNVIYFIHSCEYVSHTKCITAYDLLSKKTLKVSWSACSPFGTLQLAKLTFLQMLYLGINILCLPAQVPSNRFYTETLFNFYRFQVSRISLEEVLITPLSHHLLPVEGFMSTVNFAPL